MKYVRKIFFIVFIIAVCFHGFYYISAFSTHTLDALYENITPGQDFFAIPGAAYAFLRGGTLEGSLPANTPPYATCCPVNSNVYHPVFTLLVGVPLQFLAPWTAYFVWVYVHALITLVTILYLWRHNRKNPILYFALSIYLLVSYHYYEIKMAQFHFLVVFFIMLLLHDLEKNGDTIRSGVWLFLSLLVKPIGLLFVIPLLLYKRWKTVLVGLGFFLLATIPTVIKPETRYYILNVINFSKSVSLNHYNLYAVANFLPFSLEQIHWLSYVVAIFLILYQILKKPLLFIVLALWTCFQLLFYNCTFAYHYVVVAVILALSFLFGYLRVTVRTIFIILLFILPTPAIYFHLRGSPAILPYNEYEILAVWSSCTVVILATELIMATRRQIKSVTHPNTKKERDEAVHL
jgi:hypothetical protein